MLDNLAASTRDWVEALLILVSFWVPAIILRLVWGRMISPWFKRSKNADLVLLIRPLRVLVVWALILSGLNFALQSLQVIEDNRAAGLFIEKVLAISWTALAMVVAVRFLVGWFKYRAIRALEDREEFRERVSTSQKLITGIVVALGLLSILRIAGVDISPLLAGGAVGGIIIGLALQDSLSNVFAGLFMNIDRPIREGELLKLDQDREGFVEEVGWRYTKVRLLDDSMMIIPNSKFGQSTFINMDRAVSHLSVTVLVNIGYGADLDEVERLAIEAAEESQATLQATSVKPYVRWLQMGEKMLTFKVYMRIEHSAQQYRLSSECIRRLYQKFRANGIPFPTPSQIPTPASAIIEQTELPFRELRGA